MSSQRVFVEVERDKGAADLVERTIVSSLSLHAVRRGNEVEHG